MSKKIKAQSINKVTAILSVVFGVGFLASLSLNIYPLIKEEEVNADSIFIKANEALTDYQYASVTIDRLETVDDNKYRQQFTLTTQRDKQYCTYMFLDSEGSDLYQCWRPSESKNIGYDIWVHSDEYDTWVSTYYDKEPADSNLWSFMSSGYGYTLMSETYPWYDTGDECYVLQMASSSSEWQNIYEELYIRKSDYLPMGIVVMATQSTDAIDHTEIEENVDFGDGTTGDAVSEVHKYNSVVQKYSVVFSNEDLRLFDIPDTFITEEDYAFLIQEDMKKEENENND